METLLCILNLKPMKGIDKVAIKGTSIIEIDSVKTQYGRNQHFLGNKTLHLVNQDRDQALGGELLKSLSFTSEGDHP